jgi:hypothetical protein
MSYVVRFARRYAPAMVSLLSLSGIFAQVQAAPATDAVADTGVDEVGRASCRERVLACG